MDPSLSIRSLSTRWVLLFVMEKEIWKDIKGYEGLYQVSNHGRVRSLDRIAINGRRNGYRKIKGRILRAGKHTGGYVTVTLSKESVTKSFVVHRLVAESFVNNPLNKPEVNHIDAIKTNNYYKNLEWVTSSENTIKGLELGIMNTARGEQKPNSVLKEEQVIEVKKRILKGDKNSVIAKDFGVHYMVIQEIKKGRNWKHVKI